MLKKSNKIAYLYLLVTFCAWGSLYVVSKFVLGKVPTFTILFIRFLIAGIALSIILKQRGVAKISREDYKYIFIIGFFGYFISMGAQFLGTKFSNASLSSLINSMNPITITLFASFILKEKLTVKSIFSVMLVLIGVEILIGDINVDVQLVGILSSIFSVIIWSFVSVLIKKVSIKYDSFQITVYGILIGALFNFPISIYELMTIQNIKFDWYVISALLYMGIVCTALAHVLWNKSLSLIEARTCSLFYPVQPMIAAILGSIFLGEDISKNFVIGAALIIGGVIFNIVGSASVGEKVS